MPEPIRIRVFSTPFTPLCREVVHWTQTSQRDEHVAYVDEKEIRLLLKECLMALASIQEQEKR